MLVTLILSRNSFWEAEEDRWINWNFPNPLSQTPDTVTNPKFNFFLTHSPNLIDWQILLALNFLYMYVHVYVYLYV